MVTAINETLEKTNLGKWELGTVVNLERCMKMDGRLDGHIVQGHVDKTGEVVSIENKDGSYFITMKYENDGTFVTVPQGSITVNGISLTVAKKRRCSVFRSHYSLHREFTNMKHLKIGDKVNPNLISLVSILLG